MESFVFYKEKWEQIKGQLIQRLRGNTIDIHGAQLGAKIAVELMDDDNLDRKTVIKREFDQTISMSDCANADTIYLCCQRMVDLCQVMDYGPAGAWLGMFCEEVLEDYSDAKYWYNKAASFGYGIGMYRVGLLYLYKKVALPGGTNLKRCFTDAVAHGVEEAQQILDEYFDGDTVHYPNGDEDGTQENVAESTTDNGASIKVLTTILPELIENGRKNKFLPAGSGVPNIIEIAMAADDVCAKIFANVEKLIPEQGAFAIMIYFVWSAYAGMGAVMHWHLDWDRLSRNGIYETLTAPRGFDCMDEYVTKLIGMKFGRYKSNKLVKHLKEQAALALTHVAFNNYEPAAKAMYLYGMVYEMYKIGLR